MYDSRLVKIAAAVGVLVLTLGVQGCPRETVGWTYGGYGYDVAYAVQETSDGNYIVAGYSDSNDDRDYGVYLLKVDPTGAELWSRAYLEPETSASARAVQETSDGGFALAGTKYSYEDGNDRMFLVKTDASGELLWEKTFSEIEEYESDAYAVQETSDGGLVVAGSIWARIPGKVDYSYFHDMYLVKTDEDGNLLWSQRYSDGNGADTAQAVQETSDGGLIVAGYTHDILGDYREAMYLVRTDVNGNILWEGTFAEDEGHEARAYGVEEMGDGGFVIAGNSWDPYGYGLDDSYHGPVAYAVKTDADGNLLWDSTYGEPEDETYVYAMDATSDGGFVLAGERYAGPPYFSSMCLTRIDADGGLLWDRSYGHPGRRWRFAYDVQETSSGGFILAGESEWMGVYTFDTDAYLVRTDADGNPVSGNP